MRPIDHARNMSMLYRIEVNVIDMPIEIGFVADGMLPITALPDSFLSFADFAGRARSRIKTSRKATLDEIPTDRKIRIRENPNCVKVIGQNADRYGLEWTLFLNRTIDFP